MARKNVAERFQRTIGKDAPSLELLIDQHSWRLAYATKARAVQRVKEILLRHMGAGHAFSTFARDAVRQLEEHREGNERLCSDSYLRMVYHGAALSAYGLAVWQQGMTWKSLNEFPAWRFVRVPGSRIKRKRHEQHENDVQLKTNWRYWADFQNGADIGGFELPWPQFGYNSHMIQEPVSFAVAARRGLVLPSQRGRLRLAKNMRFAPDFPANYKKAASISLRGMDAHTKRLLLAWLKAAGIPARFAKGGAR